MNEKQEAIERLLLKAEREGMGGLIMAMREGGFFEAPCSGKNHLSCIGGLAEHSLNVFHHMVDLNITLKAEIPDESIIICALLHDLGKMGQFGKPNYVPNMLTGRATKANPNPEPYQSETKPFETNSDLIYVDHEVRSVAIASQYIRLTEDEQWAILMHNGLYGNFRYVIPGKETKMYLLLHMSDMWASRVTEG